MKQEQFPAPPWPGWSTTALLGRGGFGAVYEIERDNFGSVEQAAMKVITIPQNDSDIEELYSGGYTFDSISAHYTEHMKSIVHEYSLMARLKGCANVVYCDDVYQQRHADGVGWDIFIRMELLTPLLRTRLADYDEAAAIRLGADLANALRVCQEQNIIHRDIKPQNIFVSTDGTCKLGDFGIAKVAERTTSGTKIGTYKYMAPEVYHDAPYGAAADVYSLGMVLYWLMNDRCTPFVPAPPAIPTHEQEEQAKARRFAGEPLPEPKNGSPELKSLVLRCCAYDPADRPGVEELLEQLTDLRVNARLSRAGTAQPKPAAAPAPPIEQTLATGSAGKAKSVPKEREVPTGKAWLEEERTETRRESAPRQREQAQIPVPPAPKKHKNKTVLAALLPAAVLALLCAAYFVVIRPLLLTPSNTGEAVQPSVETAAAETSQRLSLQKNSISAGFVDTVGLKSDGTVVAVGYNGDGQCEVFEWNDIVAVSAGYYHTVGLKSDGTVVSTAAYDDVSEWNDIVAVSAGWHHTVIGLKSDGTVVAVGNNEYGQCDVSEWKDIVAVSAGALHTVGLKSGDKVVAVGDNKYGQCDVSEWNDIAAVSAGALHTVGLKSDGTAVAVGSNKYGQCDVSDWKDVVAVSAGKCHTVGLKSDGTVVAVGDNEYGECDVSDWKDVVAVSAGYDHTVGLKSDGTVVAVGDNALGGQCEVSGWTDIMLPEQIPVSLGSAAQADSAAETSSIAEYDPELAKRYFADREQLYLVSDAERAELYAAMRAFEERFGVRPYIWITNAEEAALQSAESGTQRVKSTYGDSAAYEIFGEENWGNGLLIKVDRLTDVDYQFWFWSGEQVTGLLGADWDVSFEVEMIGESRSAGQMGQYFAKVFKTVTNILS